MSTPTSVRATFRKPSIQSGWTTRAYRTHVSRTNCENHQPVSPFDPLRFSLFLISEWTTTQNRFGDELERLYETPANNSPNRNTTRKLPKPRNPQDHPLPPWPTRWKTRAAVRQYHPCQNVFQLVDVFMFAVIEFLGPSGLWIISLLSVAFWIGMLVHCYLCEPDREFWFFTMLIIPPASVVYLLARILFSRRQSQSRLLKRLGSKRDIERKRIAAEQIGNPYQHIEYGDALRENGRHTEARDAYHKALAREPENLPALWGAALSEIELEEYASAKDHLTQILHTDREYKFGDVSLAYGVCLCKMNETEAAAEHLTQHINRWRHPEAMYTLALIHADRENPAAARDCLQSMFMDIDSSPKSIARRQSHWRRKGKKLLNRLPKG